MTPGKKPRGRRKALNPFADPEEHAEAASLRYVSDDHPGIGRRRSGRGFTYPGLDGRPTTDRDTLKRIRSLAIPPAWTDVWICADPDGHLQATGRDARGRKQYRYHKEWRVVRDQTKYGKLLHFGEMLPRIRARVQKDLERPGMPRAKLLATIIRLLERTLIRVGNEEYARTNRSFGLTTMLGRHVQVEGTRIQFRFRGKSGKSHEIAVSDRRLAGLVKKLRELPGQDLFQYLDEEGNPQPISSADVNEYLRDAAEEEFTAKDFRTWAGTLLAASLLKDSGSFDSDASPKSIVAAAVESVAKQLGNTPTICRKSYIHPAVLEAYQNRKLFDLWISSSEKIEQEEGLSDEESALLHFLARSDQNTSS